jgi:hypothetical protein
LTVLLHKASTCPTKYPTRAKYTMMVDRCILSIIIRPEMSAFDEQESLTLDLILDKMALKTTAA